jgi:hypothetical protein
MSRVAIRKVYTSHSRLPLLLSYSRARFPGYVVLPLFFLEERINGIERTRGNKPNKIKHDSFETAVGKKGRIRYLSPVAPERKGYPTNGYTGREGGSSITSPSDSGGDVVTRPSEN